MYQPIIQPDQIHALWLLRKATGKPMTALLREALAAYLASSKGGRPA